MSQRKKEQNTVQVKETVSSGQTTLELGVRVAAS